MVRRLPWTHPHLKAGHAAESKSTTRATATVTATTSSKNGIDTGTRDISSYFTTKMVSRTPRSGGRRLMYNGGGGGSSRTASYTPAGGDGGGGRTSSPSPPPSQKKRLDGLFLEGNWYCNCQPRQFAKFLQVSKKTANRGRWFYTCEKRRGGCNFFLWAEDAENRAEGATMTLPPMPQGDGAAAAAAATPRRTTSLAQAPTPSTASTIKPAARATAPAHSAAIEPPPSPTAQRSAAKQKFMDTYFKNRPIQVPEEEPNELMVTDEEAETTTTPAPRKRKRVLFDFDSDEGGGEGEDNYGLDDVSSGEERAMTEAMERSAKKLRVEGPPTTPAAQRTLKESALPTPQTVTRTLFPDAKRRGTGVGDVSPGNVSFSTSTASSATIGHPAAVPNSSPPTSTPQEEQLDPTEEVMALLRGQQKGGSGGVGGGIMDESTARAVRELLGRFSMKAKGLARGRDTVRTALRAKDEKIAELQERVASLEARARTQREQIADFKAGMMDLYSKH
ncbi:hypothetical protein CORC01_05774 [Colletotrichum orchidophilum]|uniref:GRF-type domain-containing protein n=1 Tax=Colletotrichum orchidophilum TaxID=1209926 RepID=A0A1G4BBW1_9PEZI|nr:uncharacterized protein CORC01_05774 [Colletotrichum orchidophilum]OHE98878.1 hypothetical protein CORC01_05774 [Colletotrichum orchidophilum]